jgi:UDP-N-acetylglucosamine acyltransferase
MSITVHPTAIIEPGAVLGEGCSVGAYSIIRSNVVLGRNNKIGPHVVIEGHTSIGDDNTIFQFASVGAVPQDLKFHGEASRLEIGDKNIIRECVTLQPGTEGGGMLTKIGNSNLFMANSHVGHDSIVGSNNWFANSAALAGHVLVGNFCIMAGVSGLHQFSRLGDLCFVAAGSMVSQDVPPFCMVHGNHARLIGLNKIGLTRKGFSPEQVTELRKVYRSVVLGKGKLADRVATARQNFANVKGANEFLEFFTSSQRGICAARSRRDGSDGDEGES